MVTGKTKVEFKDLYRQINKMKSDKQGDMPLLDPAEDAKRQRIERSKYDAQFFFKTYLGDYFKQDPAPYHTELPTLLKYKQRPLVIMAPRGGAKSTFLFGETLRLLVTGEQKFMIRIEESEQIARKEILKIRNEIESNRQLRADFGDLQGSPWGALELYFSNDCMLWGRGKEQTIRGTTHRNWRPTGIIYNDIETVKQVRNQELTDEIYDKLFTEAIPALNPPSAGGGFLAIVGTLLGKDSMLAKLRANPNTRKVYYEALDGDPQIIELLLSKVSRDIPEISYYLKDIEGDTDEDLEKQRNFFRSRKDYMELISQVTSYWPSRFPVEDLLITASQVGVPVFKQEFLHIPINSSSVGAFDDTWFERASNNYIVDDIPMGNLVRATFLDPSYRDSSSSDNKAFVTGFYDISTQTGYIIDVTASQTSFDDMIDTSFKIARKYLIGDVIVDGRHFPSEAFVDSIFGYEDNGAQQWLNSIFRDNAKRYKFHLPKLTGIGHPGNKEVRISRLSYYIERAKVKMDMTKDSHKLLKNELCNLGNRKIHDDRADALEGWWSIVEKVQSRVILMAHDQVLNRAPHDTKRFTFREPIYKKKPERIYKDRSRLYNHDHNKGLIL